MKDFRGKVAAITGAASGIGRALAIQLSREGADVAIADIDERGLAETARMCKGPGKVSSKALDVADARALEAWAKEVASEHGGCNLIFNNAGIALAATAENGDKADFERLMNINFWGVVNGTRAFMPYLRASGEGHVINISSIFGIVAFPGNSFYNAAKFGVRGFTEALRIELEIMDAPVSATCVHPGGIKTNIVKSSRTHHSMADLGVDIESDIAKNEFERMFKTTPEEAAAVILKGVKKNKRRVLIGADARMFDFMQRLLPGSYHAVVIKAAKRVLQKRGPAPSAAKPAPAPSPSRTSSELN